MHDNTTDTEALNTKYLEIERSYQMARLYSNRASIPASEYLNTSDKIFVACFQFGRHVTSTLLSCLDDSIKSKVAKGLCDEASATHDDICNNVVSTFCFTDADSTTCPCQIEVEELDVFSCIIDDLRKGHGQEGNKIEKLHDALNPVADALIAIACLERDDAALETAKRIKTLLLA
jgi:hypothetical protein